MQVAKNRRHLDQKIVTLSQLHVINVQQLCDLDGLAVRWDMNDIHSISQEECKGIIAKIKIMQKKRTPVQYSGFSLNNLAFKMWLHLKMLIDVEMLLID